MLSSAFFHILPSPPGGEGKPAELKFSNQAQAVSPPWKRLVLQRNERKGQVNRGDKIFRTLVFLMALSVVLVMAFMIYEMVRGAWPSIQKFGFKFLTGSKWNPVSEEYGALPFIYGTVVSSAIALTIAIPLSIGAAIYLAEYAPKWLRSPLSFLIELLAAIPSVVYGLWGIFVLVPWIRTVVQPFLNRWFGFIPLFQGSMYGIGMLSAGIILAIMVVPYISSVSREVIMAVPYTQREAALALGSTKWEAIRIAVLRYCKSGILGAVILGLGRAIGETMAVTMVIGNTPQIKASIFEPAHSMASVIANEFAEATSTLYLSVLIEIGLVLLVIALIVNVSARLLVWTVARGPQGNPTIL